VIFQKTNPSTNITNSTNITKFFLLVYIINMPERLEKFTRAEMKKLVIDTVGRAPSKDQLDRIIAAATQGGAKQVVRIIKKNVPPKEGGGAAAGGAAPKKKMLGLKQAPKDKPKRKYVKKPKGQIKGQSKITGFLKKKDEGGAAPKPKKKKIIKKAAAKGDPEHGVKQFAGGGMNLKERHVRESKPIDKKDLKKADKGAKANPTYSSVSPAKAKGGYNKDNSKMKCYMRKAKNGATYRTCGEPEGDAQPKKQLRNRPKARDIRNAAYQVAYPDRNRGKPPPTTPKTKKIVKRKKK